MVPTSAALASLFAAALIAAPAAAQCELAVLTPPGSGSDLYGYSVALSGEWAFVGEPFEDQAGANSGVVHVYRRSGGTWGPWQTLAASDAQSQSWFGNELDVSGDRLVVGADGWASQRGKVYVFELQGSTWTERAILTASDGVAEDRLGWAVAIEGDTALAGAFGNAEVAPGAGAVYVYERVGGVWSQADKLTASNGVADDWFGVSLAMRGGRAVIGASGRGAFAGTAYVFERVGGTWIQRQELLNPSPSANGYYGSAVALDGDRALVGEYLADDALPNSGSVHVFELLAGVWSATALLTAADAATNAAFGVDVALQGERAWIGASGAPLPFAGEGACYAFRREPGGVWELAAQSTSRGAYSLGLAVALDGETGVATSLDQSAHFVQLLEAATWDCACAGGAPCGNADPIAGCAHSAGYGARLRACGSASVAADDLVLSADRLPVLQPVVLFAATDALAGPQPFGDGLLCSGGSFVRFPPVLYGADWSARWGPGLAATGGWSAGDTRRFQARYRDPLGPCGAGFNATDVVELVFAP